MTAAIRPSTVDRLVDATPETRERMVDLLRAVSIGVVILWHWVFSVTQVNSHDALTMPNPIEQVPLLWLGTWFLQIMPVFFFVGGYANLASRSAGQSRGETNSTWVGRRLRRLLAPIGLFLAVWTVGDLIGQVLVPGYRSVRQWGVVVFVPLWFIGVYTAVIVLAPLTIRWHQRRPRTTLAALVTASAAVDLLRFAWGADRIGLVNSLLVFVFAHQLGYFWRDGTLTRGGRRTAWTVLLTGLAALVTLTASSVYPRSMVSVRSDAISNMFPTTAAIAALAVFQLGIVLVLRPAAERLLARRRVWKAVVATNGIAMTLFTWHMTALVAAIGIWRLAGHQLLTRPTAGWWAQRPLWLVGPGLILAGLVAIFARFELPRLAPPHPTRSGVRDYAIGVAMHARTGVGVEGSAGPPVAGQAHDGGAGRDRAKLGA